MHRSGSLAQPQHDPAEQLVLQQQQHLQNYQRIVALQLQQQQQQQQPQLNGDEYFLSHLNKCDK